MRNYRVTINPRPLARTAGEVRFVKDKSDSNQWAFDDGKYQPQRDIDDEHFVFNPKQLKPLACALRSLLMALGHAMSGYQRFSKIKSRLVSPDGMLGGKGYILKIKDVRSMLMNSVEVLSAVTDTLYDEINAPHWKADGQPDKEVGEVLDDVEDIREDPEEYAREEEAEQDSKTASAQRVLYAFERLSSNVQVHSPYGVVWEGPYRDLYSAIPHPSLRRLMASEEVEVPADLVDYAIALHHNDMIYRVAGKGGLDV